MVRLRRLFTAAMWLNLLAVTATAKTVVIPMEPGAICEETMAAIPIVRSGDSVFALSRRDQGRDGAVAVFHKDAAPGWASRRLFARFTLESGEAGILACKAAQRGG